MGGTTYHFGVLGSGVGSCVAAVICVAVGQGILRAARASSAGSTKRQPAKSARQAEREKLDEDIRKIVGWGFTGGGGVFLTIGIINLTRVLVSAVAR